MWPVIITLIIVTALLIFKIAEGMWELDQWIDDIDKRWSEEYDYVHDQYINKSTIIKPEEPTPTQKPVNILAPSLKNFPKTSEDTKAKIARLMKNKG